MAQSFQFELVSPERLLLSEQVAEVIVPGSTGEFGVLAGHSQYMTTLQPGILKVRRAAGAALDEYFVRGGFADVANGGLSILAQQAIPVSDIDAETLSQQIKDAEEDVSDAKDDEARQRADEVLSKLKEVQAALSAA